MSELRIRSEAVAEEVWAQPYRPPSVHAGAIDDDDSDFGPLLTALEQPLTRLFGLPTMVRAGRPPVRVDGLALEPVAPVLAALLATLRLGGDPARAGGAGGVALARHAAAIAGVIADVAAVAWPAACRLPQFDIVIACSHAGGACEGHAWVLAPARAEVPPPLPVAALGGAVLALPMRVRVELSAEVRMVASLLPLRAGQVLAISPTAEMPLIIGRHRIGKAMVTALPDGGQSAEIVGIGVDDMGGRA
ncbi:hypothetical protein [Polymorphobacter fuscus]|uniref:Uncharacterized protein n=1 Tax=Sandarakinorhabdus fusca TaxID=1439888 RepID=A0A7C9KUY5_9SPHN|nr:hypothetical protein [Polymorphobacter fuscus]KAB7648332.1 hypothetical protein F9290_01015 [Polymorphobacter fuscus]MQT15845.1 hypothetical protein [Polymorphobacter fuscus]NJC07882.1 hypothetical protein [Polymorphobacter fuscus]